MRTILITGGGGSLGKAFVRLLHKDNNVIVYDQSEWAVAELLNEYGSKLEVYLKDFADYDFSQNPADVVIHCAAYKHVNLGETNTSTFILNNLVKTEKLFKEASMGGADILFISTDKAVEPINDYGYTKALGESLTKQYNGSVARLGNILSSSGSVIPVWEQAIKNKEPIKITDEKMIRYVIEDNDAVSQIWQGFLKGDKLIIPVCEKVRLLDMLTDVLNRHGYKKASDYKPGVEIIGMRQGEKLIEKLKWNKEEK